MISATVRSAMLDNSLFWRRFTEIARDSVFVRFFRAARRLAGSILGNSLAAGFMRDKIFPRFLVGDYFDRDISPLVKTIQLSRVYRLADKFISGTLAKTRALAEVVLSPPALVRSWLSSLGTAIARGGRKRMFALIVLLYAAVFYLTALDNPALDSRCGHLLPLEYGNSPRHSARSPALPDSRER